MPALRILGLPLVLTLASLAGGCIVEIEHSIIDKPVLPDERLAGVWALEASGNAQVLTLYRDDDNPEDLRATFVIVDKRDVQPSRATLRFTSIGERAYFEARWNVGEWIPLNPPVRNSFGTYTISGAAGAETLQVCMADTESFEAPLKSGALKGFSGGGKNYERRVVVSSEGAELRDYLAKNHFTCRASSTFRRVSGPSQSK